MTGSGKAFCEGSESRWTRNDHQICDGRRSENNFSGVGAARSRCHGCTLAEGGLTILSVQVNIGILYFRQI
jgi:hypothetical protein